MVFKNKLLNSNSLCKQINFELFQDNSFVVSQFFFVQRIKSQIIVLDEGKHV